MKACVSAWLNEQFGGDADIVGSVYDEYKSTLGRLIGELAQAIANADRPAIDHVLHTIKGSAAMVGDNEVSALAAESRKLTDLGELQSVHEKLKGFAICL